MKTLEQDPMDVDVRCEQSIRNNITSGRSQEGRGEGIKSKTCLLYQEMKDWYRREDSCTAKPA
jgi:hypothetical protein